MNDPNDHPVSSEQSFADRMYPSTAPTAGPAAPAATGTPSPSAEPADPVRQSDTAPAQVGDSQGAASTQLTVEDLLAQEQSPAQRMYADGSYRPDTPEGYDTTLGSTFEPLQYQARYDARTEDVQALAEGRKEAAAMLHELQVPTEEARELTQTLGDWFQREPQTEDQRWDAKERAIATLEKQWGKETHARVKLAQQTADEACKRLPWLADLLRSGAGNDPKLIQHFAEIGLRRARKARA